MRSEPDSVKYGDVNIGYAVFRRDRKTLEIAVEPDSTVKVVAPITASLERIAQKVRKRACWIVQQQRYFEQFKPRTPNRRYVSGETHLYMGRQYRLKVEKAGTKSVKLIQGYIVVQSTDPKNSSETKRLVELWYTQKARLRFQERIELCIQRFPQPEAMALNGVALRHMQKRWGAMSPNRRLLLNLRLIQAPVCAIDYVITHELCHLSEYDHSPRFYRLLNRVMSDWEKRKARMERLLS
jgi:predicted metal-dependent hydrolase